MKLFVGLGNPGSKYARNRHNIGFLAVERIADRHGFSAWRKRFQGFSSEGTIGSERVVLLKPETYMNESGRAVGEAARFLKIELGDIVVFHDELDLIPGKIKVKTGGGNAGHNGLRSITAHLGNEYQRVRLGIGHPGHKDLVHNWVLNDFAKADQEWLTQLLDAVADAAGRLAGGDQARFLTDVARALQDEDETPPPSGKKPREDKGEARSAKSSGPHPAGERGNKRENALAENLRKFLAGRKPKYEGS
jgi:PTH1 family peptidyl-tRNA hydrolase